MTTQPNVGVRSPRNELTRTVSWFRAAGLDLIEADEPAIAEFVRCFREGLVAADESGSAAG